MLVFGRDLLCVVIVKTNIVFIVDGERVYLARSHLLKI